MGAEAAPGVFNVPARSPVALATGAADIEVELLSKQHKATKGYRCVVGHTVVNTVGRET